jgi:hypothetical protein
MLEEMKEKIERVRKKKRIKNNGINVGVDFEYVLEESRVRVC